MTNLSITKITFLNAIPSTVKVDTSSKVKYHTFESLTFFEIKKFVLSITEGNTYLVTPIFSVANMKNKPMLLLSEPFLINNRSNSMLIHNFIVSQWNDSGFNVDQDIQFSFRYKKVFFPFF